MDKDRIEAQADSSTNNFAESEEDETLSISDTSSQEEENREPKNKMKLRSIKLSRLTSFGSSCIRPQKSPSSTPSPSLYSQHSTPISITDAKATNCSDARKETLQKSSAMSKKSLTRMSSKRKLLKKIRSNRVAGFGSSGSSTMEESTDFCNDQHRKDAEDARSTSDSSTRIFKRTSSLRAQRVLTKTASLKSKRGTMKKCSQVSGIPDSNVERATCSSALKNNKFPRKVEVKTGGGESGGNSAMRVCSYSYCSLHGHRHGNLPPLKRFVSMRRRLLKNQKSVKPESRSIPKGKRATNRRIGTQTSQIVGNGDSADKERIQDSIANSSVTEKVFKPEFNRAGRDCENISQPHLSFEQNKTSDSLTAKPETQVAFSSVQETSKEGQIAAPSTHSGDDEPILSVDHHKFTETSFPELKDSKLDGIVSSSNEEVPECGIVHQEANGDSATSLNLEVSKANSESNIEAAVGSSTNRVIGRENSEEFGLDNDFLEGNSPSGDWTLNSTTDEPHKIQTEKRKYRGFWGVIYQHMKSGIAEEVETELPLVDDKSREEPVKDDSALLQKNESDSSPSLSGTDQNMGMGECDAGDQKFEPWQSDAIKLVQEAFDKILSEIPDHSSDDQLISSDIASEQDLLERNYSDGGERSISSSSVKQNPEESEVEAVDINSKTLEEEKAASEQEKKASRQISKNWSNLKKVILLKRFVKALEKVRNFNPRKPRYLPVEPDPEAEKVNLRHQTVEERKNADEWMLDYALRQVISKLAPAQKRKVALLVQAFETVTPPTDIKTLLSFNAECSSHATPVQACNGSSSVQSGERNNSGLLGKAPYLEMSFNDTPDEVSNISTAKRNIPGNLEDEETVAFNLEKDNNSTLTDERPDLADITSTKLEESRLSDKPSSKPYDTGSTAHEEFLINGKILPKGCKEVSLIHDSEIRDCGIEFNSKRLEAGNLIDADGEQSCDPKSELSSIVNSVVSSASFSELLEEPIATCGGEANSKHDVLRETSPQEESEPHDTIDMVNLIDADGEQSREPKSELSSIVSSVVSSTPFSELSEEPMEACGGQANNPKHAVFRQSSPREESEPRDTNDTEPEYKLEKQKYMKLWYLVYKHMVSSSAEDGAHLLEGAESADKEEQGGAEKLLGTEDADSSKDSSEMNQKTLKDNQIASSQVIERRHIEAIKLIEEAIDDIPLPEIQDDSTENQSIPGSMISEQDFQKKHGESREIFLSNTTDSAEDSFRESNNTKLEQGTTLDPKETCLHSNNISALEESETELKSANKSKLQTQKSWSNLKKMILLKRFVKALEKVRKFNPREPQFLHLDSDPETEKVNLRHQSMKDRKNAEEWMLDHALQQVVAKLTPARKRKVELLVEAFETVTPSLEVKTRQQRSTAASPHARLIHI